MILPVSDGFDDAELRRLAARHRDRGNRDAGADGDVVLDHLSRIHVVDVIGTEHADDVGTLVADQVEVLIDRVGRAAEPLRPATHLRGHRCHVVAEQRRESPRLADVAVEAVALVLRQHDDLQIAAVGEVRQDEVDDPVACRRTAPQAWPGRSSAAPGACLRHRPARRRGPSVLPWCGRLDPGRRGPRRQVVDTSRCAPPPAASTTSRWPFPAAASPLDGAVASRP